MVFQSSAQFTHDRINLIRFVSKLESSVGQDDWLQGTGEPSPLTVQGALQKVKHARKMLNNVQAYEEQHSSQQGGQSYLEEVQATLDRLLQVVQDAQTRLPTRASRPTLLLPTIPAPTFPVRAATSALSPGAGPALSPGEEAPAPLLTSDLLLGPDESELASAAPMSAIDAPLLPLSSERLPAPLPAPPTTGEGEQAKPKPTPAFLQNSQAVQDELSAQLAAMAAQLKRNAVHFAQTLDADKDLVLSAGEKLEQNFDVMTKERVRLRDRGVAARGSTCFVLIAVVGVVIAFAVMVLVIRVT